jgi:hypothetical protein
MEKPQIQRYIELGRSHVTYLTTRDSIAPKLDLRGRKFRLVKYALFEDLHEGLRGARITGFARMFRDFMEEHDMAGPQPFDHKELKRAGQAFDLYKKCQGTLAMVRAEINNGFRSNFKTKENLTRPTFEGGPDYGWVRSYLGSFKRGAVKTVGIGLHPEDGNLYFTVYLWGNLDPSISKIRST